MMKNFERLQKMLKNVDIFSSLNNNSLKLLMDKMRLIVFEPGEVICKEDDKGSSMYLLDTGEISVLKKGKAGKMIEITTLKPGEVAGIMSLFEKEPRSATLKAMDRVELWEMDAKTFKRIFDNNPGFSQSILKVLSGYLRKETKIVAELRSYDEDNRLKIAVFDSKPYMEKAFNEKNRERYALKFYKPHLNSDTVSMAEGFKVICLFVNDILDAPTVEKLKNYGVEMIALRCAGFNNIDIKACGKYGISVARVPAYSPYAVAEHSVALMMALNRHISRANSRIKEGNFSLDGLVGFDMFGKTIGVIGTGKIGKCLINIMLGYGCNILAYDLYRDKTLSETRHVSYVGLDELYGSSDIITLHAPLTPESHHLIGDKEIKNMKQGVMIINTSRGGLLDTRALINGLLNGKIGSAGLDVYEEESRYFFEDHSQSVIADETLARLTTFNNVLVTSHMGFLTREALGNIAETTFMNIAEYEKGIRGKELTNGIS